MICTETNNIYVSTVAANIVSRGILLESHIPHAPAFPTTLQLAIYIHRKYMHTCDLINRHLVKTPPPTKKVTVLDSINNYIIIGKNPAPSYCEVTHHLIKSW